MRRPTVLAVFAALLVGSLGWAAPAAAQGAPAAAQDCNTEGAGWPKYGRAEGATFLGVATGRFRNENYRLVYTFDVLKVYAGDFGPTVHVELVCFPTGFWTGRTYLVSSGSYSPTDGRDIHHLRYLDNRSVAWRVFEDRSVRLLKPRSVPPPLYLKRPDTLREAVRAVTPG